ncbi:hypothetical protein EDEG_02160 [Edhazardia aedis USNM 41457]|uniref:Uncharacterized protein n=1 Tax=Edhazardia aedis (strain USNM 41457) TaxID=1003232 RepID=J9D7K6_EDHAE|nr:hypothetical protein EDEG_02160 [Edhazardia aedis USNM 41457]|eukprot:EJW03504.1 hypothetical protein EDEG_02160 [Edhazardia aedis USNM 41457]
MLPGKIFKIYKICVQEKLLHNILKTPYYIRIYSFLYEIRFILLLKNFFAKNTKLYHIEIFIYNITVNCEILYEKQLYMTRYIFNAYYYIFLIKFYDNSTIQI